MIIVIANSKGGVGKSTIAVHSAAWLHELGHKVALADCDTQHSSSEWIRQAVPEINAVCLDSPDTVLNELPRLHDEADYVVADGPGSQTEISARCSCARILPSVPCKASILEVRALAKATEVLRQAQDIRNGLPHAVAVLSMVGQNYRLTRDMKEAADALELPLASSPLTLTATNLRRCAGQAAVVWKLGAKGRDAAREIEVVFREIPTRSVRRQGKVVSMQHRAKRRASG